jgi:hypothetical protein
MCWGNIMAGGLTEDRPDREQLFTYDVLDRLKTVNGGGAYPAIYDYDAHGNRTPANGTHYDYYPNTLRLWHQGYREFTYDNNGNLWSETAPSRQYTYTPFNMLETVTEFREIRYAYDGDNWRIKKTDGANTTVYLRGIGNELLTELTNPGSNPRRLRDYIYAGGRLIAVVKE